MEEHFKKGRNAMEILLGKRKRFYKANLHCHTTLSDGALTPEEVKAAYQARGYSIVAFTDHEHIIDNSHLNDEGFLTIPSCELAIKEFPEQSSLKNMDMRVCHLNFYALDPKNCKTPCYASEYDHYVTEATRGRFTHDGEYTRRYSTDGINEMIRIGREQGFLVSYNHPSWSLENACDYLGYEGLFAVEIYNHSCAVSGHHTDEQAFDAMLRAGKHIYCTAADDNHNKRGLAVKNPDSFGGFVMIEADALDYGQIMAALQAGDFYASSGPEILSLTREGDTVRVKTSPADRILMITHGRRIARVEAKDGGGITEAELTLRESDGYFRIRVEGQDGGCAYTQAYPVKPC